MARRFETRRRRPAQARDVILEFRFGLENEIVKSKVKVAEVAERIVGRFGTRDVFEIAVKSGVKIVYERWHPTTIGEFNRKNKIVCVNLNASETIEKIIAHELGHFFALNLNLGKKEEENFACEFAEILLEN